MNNNFTPWVEKYRPINFENIVLDKYNKKIMENIINKQNFPHLLLYGPPGTGKTTTIINLVNAYQEKHGKRKKELMIHLNASDERGIDIIRNQIYQFVNSKTLFNTGTKFIILDEVDYMTKNAQYALKYLLQTYSNNNIRFCLICNYISRIDESLQNEFIRLRFNQLPKNNIILFLKKICKSENLCITDELLYSVQKLYKSDIRSMINHLQSQQDYIENKIINKSIWDEFTNLITNHNSIDTLKKYIYNIVSDYNINIKNIIKDYCNYIIRYKTELISSDFLNTIEFIMHVQDFNTNYILNYSLVRFCSLFNSE
jgi:DNA polymerase III delta prime subunit